MSKDASRDPVAEILSLIEQKSGITQDPSETVGEYFGRVSQETGVNLTELTRVLSRLMYAPPEQAIMSRKEQKGFEELLSKLEACRPAPKPVEKPKPKEVSSSVPSGGYPTLDLGVERRVPTILQKTERIALKNKEKALLVGLAIFNVISRFYLIDNESLWLDEFDAAYAIAPGLTWEKVSSYLFSSTWTDHHPPLYHLIMHHWIKVFGNSELGVRSFSAFMGIATIICTYYITKNMFNWKVGSVSALFLSLNYVHLYYSQEARPYTLAMLLVILSTYSFYKMLNKSGIHRMTYVLTAAMLIYVDYFGFFLLGIHFIYFLFSLMRNKNFKERKYVLLTFLAISLVYMPWVSELMWGYSTYQPWKGYLQQPGLDELVSVLATVFGGSSYWGGLQFVLPRLFGGTFLFGIYLPGVLLAQRFWFSFVSVVVSLGLYGILRTESDKKAEGLILLASTIPLIMFVLSITVKAIFCVRQVSTFLPVISILTGLSVCHSAKCLSNHVGRKTKSLDEKRLLVAILLVFTVMWSVTFTAYYEAVRNETIKEDWRSAVRYVEGLGIKNVAIYPDYNKKCFFYYHERGDHNSTKSRDMKIILMSQVGTGLDRVDKEFGEYVLITSQWGERAVLSGLTEHNHRIETVTKKYRSLVVYVVTNPNKTP